MSKATSSTKSFRVYFIQHHDGRRTGMLLRLWDEFFDRPPPTAYGISDEDVFQQLEIQLRSLQATREDGVDRYLWDESFESRTIRVDVHPASSIKKRPVIGSKTIPLRLTYAWVRMRAPERASERASERGETAVEGPFRVMVPRFGGWFILEDLALAPEVLRHAVSSWLVGTQARWVYDFRHEGEEYVREWSPDLLARTDVSVRTGEDPFAELGKVAEEWVERASKGKLLPAVGEHPLLSSLSFRAGKSPVSSLLLVGPPGVGKTTLVRRLAKTFLGWQRAKREVRPNRLWATSAERIIAGMVYLGMWQERCLSIVRELSNEGDFLFVDRLMGILTPQSDGASIADLFAPAVAAGEIALIAECTEGELERAQRRSPSFVGYFHVLRVEEPTAQETVDLIAPYVVRKGLSITPAGLRKLASHLSAMQQDTAFPGKAFRFIDWLAQDLLSKRESSVAVPNVVEPSQSSEASGADKLQSSGKHLYPKDVSEAFARFSGLPVHLVSDDHATSSSSLAADLKKKVIGQDAACDACGRVLARFKAGLQDPERPCGTFLFVGPTGVGKTELAKTLAKTMFGANDRLIRLDMSEYQLRGSAQRLLDVSPGHESLAAAVRRQPLCLLLLDEIEKAHPEVFDLLLGVLGEGRLTDTSGRFVDFRGAMIVMTSNLGVSATAKVGITATRMGQQTMGQEGSDFLRAVRAHFRPELFNRIDFVLPFRALDRADVAKIVGLELDEARTRRGLVRRDIKLFASPAACDVLAEAGYHPTFGARPLKRVIEERVMTQVATILAGDPEFRGRDVCVVFGTELPPKLARNPLVLSL